MGIVTAHAVHDISRDRNVCFLETLSIRGVTFSTQGLQRERQKLCNVPGMRLVAAQAVPFCGRVTVAIGHLLLQVGVTHHAEVRTVRQQQGVQFRLVGVVTGAALSVYRRLMLVRSRHHALFEVAVTADAKLFLRLGRHPLVVTGVRVMTSQAFTLLVRIMDGCGFLLVKSLLVTGRT